MDVVSHNATEQERRIIERAVARLPESVQTFVEDRCVFSCPRGNDVLAHCLGNLAGVSIIDLYPGWRQKVEDGDIVLAEHVVIHEIAHAWLFAFGPDVADDEAQADRQQIEWTGVGRHAFEERDILWKLADDLECCACKGRINRADKVLSYYEHDEWYFLCPSCWAKGKGQR